MVHRQLVTCWGQFHHSDSFHKLSFHESSNNKGHLEPVTGGLHNEEL